MILAAFKGKALLIAVFLLVYQFVDVLLAVEFFGGEKSVRLLSGDLFRALDREEGSGGFSKSNVETRRAEFELAAFLRALLSLTRRTNLQINALLFYVSKFDGTSLLFLEIAWLKHANGFNFFMLL